MKDIETVWELAKQLICGNKTNNEKEQIKAKLKEVFERVDKKGEK